MSRIDAQVATQVSDVTRPVQTALDHQQQIAVARQRSTVRAPDDASLVADDAPPAHDIRSAVAHVKQVIEAASGKQLSFSVDDSGRTLLIKIIGEKGEIIRQIPSKEVLDLAKRIDALVGALVNEQA